MVLKIIFVIKKNHDDISLYIHITYIYIYKCTYIIFLFLYTQLPYKVQLI